MKRNLVLIAIVLFITGLPLFLYHPSEFDGTDGQAQEAVQSIEPEYKQWIDFVWKPSSGEMESFLFAVQAALGAGVVGYFLGFARGKSTQDKERL